MLDFLWRVSMLITDGDNSSSKFEGDGICTDDSLKNDVLCILPGILWGYDDNCFS